MILYETKYKCINCEKKCKVVVLEEHKELPVACLFGKNVRGILSTNSPLWEIETKKYKNENSQYGL